MLMLLGGKRSCRVSVARSKENENCVIEKERGTRVKVTMSWHMLGVGRRVEGGREEDPAPK